MFVLFMIMISKYIHTFWVVISFPYNYNDYTNKQKCEIWTYVEIIKMNNLELYYCESYLNKTNGLSFVGVIICAFIGLNRYDK